MLKRIVRFNPRSATARYSLGKRFLEKNILAAAQREFEEALRIAPAYVEARFALAGVYKSNLEMRRAVRELKTVIKTNPHFALACVELGRIYLENGDLEYAEFVFRKGVEAEPGVSVLYLALGSVCEMLRDTDGAYWELKEAIRLDPGNAEAHAILSHYLVGWYREGENALDEIGLAIELRPEIADYHYYLGNALACRWEYEKEREGALNAYREAIRLDPGHDRAYTATGIIYYKSGSTTRRRKR